MPGGLLGSGSAPAGNTTQTTTNPTQQAQLPYLKGGWDEAARLAQNQPLQYYPGQTRADQNPAIGVGYQGLIDTGANKTGPAADRATAAFQQIVGGGASGSNSPAYAPLMSLINNGAWAPTTDINSLRGISQRSLVPDVASNTLSDVASGKYLNNNPYLDKTFGQASDAVSRAYQTTTAPQTDSNFERGGRYGSGAMMNARRQNELGLGKTLDDLATSIYGGNYATERGLQTNAAGTLGGLVNQRLGLSSDASKGAGVLSLGEGGIVNTAASNLQTGYDTGNLNAVRGLALEPQVLSGAATPSQQITTGGQGLTAQDQASIADIMARFYGNQDMPRTNLTQYLNQIGQPTTGSTSTTSPYFQNQTANALGAATGGLGLYNGLNTATGGSLGSGLGGLFGLGAAAPSATGALTGGAGLYGGLGGAEALGGGGAAAGGADAAIASVLSAFGLISDRRLKTDIEPVGRLDNGLTVYRFRYRNAPATVHIGLMADEVERVHPDAVRSMPGGFKMVNYDLAVRGAA